jgi:hypothetical protein
MSRLSRVRGVRHQDRYRHIGYREPPPHLTTAFRKGWAAYPRNGYALTAPPRRGSMTAAIWNEA